MARFTQKAIMQTFQDMLNEMSFDKITVSALVSRCEISSNTFYYHYRDIYDLLDAWLNDQKAAFCKDRPWNTWDDTLKCILHKMQDNPRIVFHAFDSITREHLEKYIFNTEENAFYLFIQEQTKGLPVEDATIKAVSRVCCYSLLGFILKFVWTRMNMDVDSSVDQLCAIMNGMIRHIQDL